VNSSAVQFLDGIPGVIMVVVGTAEAEVNSIQLRDT